MKMKERKEFICELRKLKQQVYELKSRNVMTPFGVDAFMTVMIQGFCEKWGCDTKTIARKIGIKAVPMAGDRDDDI